MIFFKIKNKRKSTRSLVTLPGSKSNVYLQKVLKLKSSISEWDNFFSEEVREPNVNSNETIKIQSERLRSCNWVRLEVLGEPLCRKYSWAIPDERALNILGKFAPLIEIGAGSGFWARLLRDRGFDILAFDKYIYNCTSRANYQKTLREYPDGYLPKIPNNFTNNSSKMWTLVLRGGPSKCHSSQYHIYDNGKKPKRNLFLCYPDEMEEMSVKCLDHFDGEFIIHVGELPITGTISGPPQAPFGRTSSSGFAVKLAQDFHCVLSASIPRFPFSNDCITVWKRTKYVLGRGEGEDFWADIPPDERRPVDVAAPKYEQLLNAVE